MLIKQVRLACVENLLDITRLSILVVGGGGIFAECVAESGSLHVLSYLIATVLGVP